MSWALSLAEEADSAWVIAAQANIISNGPSGWNRHRGEGRPSSAIPWMRKAWPCPVRVRSIRFRAAVDWKRSFLSLKSRNCSTETVVRGRFNVGNWSCTTTTFCGSRIGRRRTRTALTTLKIAAFAPIPRASVRSTVAVNFGLFLSTRAAYRTLLHTKRHLATQDLRTDCYGKSVRDIAYQLDGLKLSTDKRDLAAPSPRELTSKRF